MLSKINLFILNSNVFMKIHFIFYFNFRLIMGTWTRQSGFPVVNVVKVSNTEYKLTQKRFLSNAGNELVQPNDSEFK